MSDQGDADVPEIFGGQFRQHCSINRVIAKRLFILLQPETAKPCRNVHVLLPASQSRAKYIISVISRIVYLGFVATPVKRRRRERLATHSSSSSDDDCLRWGSDRLRPHPKS